jgi:hypothetical protein
VLVGVLASVAKTQAMNIRLGKFALAKPLKPGEYALCFSSHAPAVHFNVVGEKK